MKRLSLLVALAIILSGTSSYAATSSIKGVACKKAGAIKTTRGYKYVCLKSGKRLVWSKGVPTNSSSVPSIPTPTPTVNEPSTPEDDVLLSIQKFIDGVVVADHQKDLKIGYFHETGNDGVFDQTELESLKYSIDFFGSLGVLTKKDLYVFIGRSQNWFADSTAGICSSNRPLVASSTASPCPLDGSRMALRSNVAGILTGKFEQVDPTEDLSKWKIDITKFGYWCDNQMFTPCLTQTRWLGILSQLPHELFHTYQLEDWSPSTLGAAPRWFVEGTAIMFQQMATTKSLPDMTYAKYLQQFLPQFKNAPNRAPDCNDAFAISGNYPTGCEYIVGHHAAEVLFAKYGGLSVIQRLTKQLKADDFVPQFEAITGAKWSDFVRDVMIHSRFMEYASR